jgi:tetraacyldisaccharide 4'-kinase
LDDHQPFTRPLLQRLEADGKRLVAQLVTTEKDAVRLPPEMRAHVLTLPVRLQLEDWGPLDAALDRALGQSQAESRQP